MLDKKAQPYRSGPQNHAKKLYSGRNDVDLLPTSKYIEDILIIEDRFENIQIWTKRSFDP